MYLMQTVSTVPRARPLPTQQPAAAPQPRSRSMDRGSDAAMLMFPGSPLPAPGVPPPPPAPDQRRRASGAAAVAAAGGLPDVDSEKKKKWSLGGLFRRRRKTATVAADDSDSSSGDDATSKRGGFLSRRRSRRDKRKPRPKIVGTFDHVVVNPLSQSPMRPRRDAEPPPAPPPPATPSTPPSSPPQSHPAGRRRDSSLSRCSSGGSGSLDGTGRRSGRRGQAMARAEAMRDQHRGDSSSDECGGFQPSPQLPRARMDDSSPSTGRRSLRTAARTERHFRRLSRDEEPSIVDDGRGRTGTKTAGRWTAVYHESCDTDPSLLTRTPSATPSPKQSPLVRQRHFRQYSPAASAAAADAARTFPPGHGFWAGSRPPPPAQGPPPPRFQPLAAPQTRPFQRGPSPGRRPEFGPGAPPRPFPSFETVYAKPAMAAAPLEAQQRSLSYDCDIHRPAPLRAPSAVAGADDVLVVQFPIARLRPAADTVSPPPPPPRDPQRRLSAAPATAAGAEPPRPMSYAFETGSPQAARVEYCLNQPTGGMASGSLRSLGPPSASSWSYQRRSCSDNQLTAPNGLPRPASATPEEMQPTTNGTHLHGKNPDNPTSAHFQYYADQNPRSRKPIHIQLRAGASDQSYLSDSQMVMKPPYQKNPPSGATDFWRQRDQQQNFHINHYQSQQQLKPYLQNQQSYQPQYHQIAQPQFQQNYTQIPQSVSQLQQNHQQMPQCHPQYQGQRQQRKPVLSAAAVAAALAKPPFQPGAPPPQIALSDRSRSNSPLLADGGQRTRSAKTRSGDSQSSLSGASDGNVGMEGPDGPRPLSMVLEAPAESSDAPTPRTAPPPPARRFSRQSSTSSLEAADEETRRRQRRSSNLEDALNELEAIYKSLRLGDEDLLDRAERREAPAYRPPPPAPEAAFPWRLPARSGAESDSGFNYGGERARRRSGAPDRVTDDMAYRRLNPKERPFSQDARALLSQSGSYLLTSPALAQQAADGIPLPPPPPPPAPGDEPDVTHDDVLFRSIKHANNTLRIADPQPPFGIPLGPVPPASNSDYLHATPVERPRSAFKPCKVPDVVKDDLAFRALRKDPQKDPALPPARLDGVEALFPARLDGSPGSAPSGNFSLRKKRAVRSLSANLMGLVNREPLVAPSVVANATASTEDLEKAQSLTDLPDALQVAQKILEGKEAIGGGPAAALRRLAEAAAGAGAAAEGIDPHYGVTPASWVERALLDRQGPSTSTETLTDGRANASSRRGSWQPRPSPPPPLTEAPLPAPAAEQSRLDDLLNALAREASATSERLDRELQQLRVGPDTQLDDNCNVVKTTLPSSTAVIKKRVSLSPTPVVRAAPSPTPVSRPAPSPTPKPPASPTVSSKTSSPSSASKSASSPSSPSKITASPTYFPKAASSPTAAPRSLPSPRSVSPTTVPKSFPSPRCASPTIVPKSLTSPRSTSPTVVPKSFPSPRSASPTVGGGKSYSTPKSASPITVPKSVASPRSPSPSSFTRHSASPTPVARVSATLSTTVTVSASPTTVIKRSASPVPVLKTSASPITVSRASPTPLQKNKPAEPPQAASPVPNPTPLRSPEAVAAAVAAANRPRTPEVMEEPNDGPEATAAVPRRHETVDDLVSQCRRDLDELLRQVDAATRPPPTPATRTPPSPEGEQSAASLGALATPKSAWAAGLEPLTALGVVLALLLSLLAMLAF